MSGKPCQALRIQCLNNQKQLALSWTLYSPDNTEKLVSNGYGTPASLGDTRLWVMGGSHDVIYVETFTNTQFLLSPDYAAFSAYLRTLETYRCPADKSTVDAGGIAAPKIRSYALT